MSNPSRSQKQWTLAAIFGAVSLGGLYFVSQVLNGPERVFTASTESGVSTTMIADRTRAASPEMSWINDASERLKTIEKLQESMSAEVAEAKLQSETKIIAIQKETDALLERYETKIEELEARLAESHDGARFIRARSGAAVLDGGDVEPGEFLRKASVGGADLRKLPLAGAGPDKGATVKGTVPLASPESLLERSGPFMRSFALSVDESAEPDPGPKRKHLGRFLPAGSYAPAVVLSGVDAPTTVQSQTDPIPVLFRITGPAVTAGTRSVTGHKIDLTGCTVTGSAKGDLSSERVLVRLIKMSCVLSNGEVFEDSVAGYMSGKGKAGARGHVVSREGPLVTNAAIAGVLGGLGEGISQVGQAGADAEQASFNQALKGAGAAAASGGVGKAASTLSEYYIERAEQYQPVVSLYGGTSVELVFMEGVDLDG